MSTETKPNKSGGAARPLIECFVAACSGTARLTAAVGHPVVHVGLCEDAGAAVADLNRRRYGNGGLWPGSFQPLEPQPGWDDWRMCALEGSAAGDVLPHLAAIEDGVIRMALPEGVAISELRERFMANLSRLRFQDVVRRPGWLEAVSDADPFADIVVHARYELKGDDFRGAILINDLIVLDPTEEPLALLWMLEAAAVSVESGMPT